MIIKRKKILLIAPLFYTYRESIALEIERQGWIVTVFDERPSNSTQTKIILRLGQEKLLQGKINNHYEKIINELESEEYSKVLFLNVEAVNEEILIRMKSVSPNSEFILYMWDSSHNKPKYPQLVTYFNRAYSFDFNDCKSIEKLNFLPLFFAEEFESKLDSKSCNYDIAFIGSGHSDRCAIINDIYKQSNGRNLKVFFRIFFPSKLIYIKQMLKQLISIVNLNQYITFTSTSFNDVSNAMKDSRAVLDIGHSSQEGLTMRVIESVGMNQKIITTSQSIKNYDFYNENMVHVIDRKNIKLPEIDFFKSSNIYDENIRKKYSIAQWVKNLLG